MAVSKIVVGTTLITVVAQTVDISPISNLLVVLVAVPVYWYQQRRIDRLSIEHEKREERYEAQIKAMRQAHAVEVAELKRDFASKLEGIIDKYDSSHAEMQDILGEVVGSIRELASSIDIGKQLEEIRRNVEPHRK